MKLISIIRRLISGKKSILGRIDAFCEAKFPDHYAGVMAVGADLEHPQSVTVYRRPLPSLDAAVLQRFPEVGAVLQFADAEHSRKELTELGNRVLEDVTQPSGRAFTFTRSWVTVEADGSAVRVVLPDADEETRQRLAQRYGPPVIIAGAKAAPSAPGAGGVDDRPSQVPPYPRRADLGEPLRYSNRGASRRSAVGALGFVVFAGVFIAVDLGSGGGFSPFLLFVLLVPLYSLYRDLVATAQELEADESTFRWRGLVGPWRSVPLGALRRVEQSGNNFYLELGEKPGATVGTASFSVSLSSPQRIRVRAGHGLLPFLAALRERAPGFELT